MYLFFDTETSGKYDFKAPATASHQPRLVQLGLQVLDREFKEVAKWSTLVQLDGASIEPEAEGIHGISAEMCAAYGLPVQHVLAILKKYRTSCKWHVCHNEKFDRGIINAAMARLNAEPFLETNGFCTMQALTPVLQLPGPRGHKWPKLQEAHKAATGREFDKAHSADADIAATVEVFKWIWTTHKQILPREMVG